MAAAWGTSLLFGGVIFLIYFWYIHFMPEMGLDSSITLLAASALTGDLLLTWLALLLVAPGLFWKRAAEGRTPHPSSRADCITRRVRGSHRLNAVVARSIGAELMKRFNLSVLEAAEELCRGFLRPSHRADGRTERPARSLGLVRSCVQSKL